MESPANLKEFDFHEIVGRQIRIINEILHSVGAGNIFDNADVTFDEWLQSENYLKFKLLRYKRNSIVVDFHFQSDGMRIDVEGNDESYDFSRETILNEEPKVKEILERLISCPILIESKGNSSFVNLFNPDGSRFAVWSLQSFSGLFFRGYWKSQMMDQHLFDPIYPSTQRS